MNLQNKHNDNKERRIIFARTLALAATRPGDQTLLSTKANLDNKIQSQSKRIWVEPTETRYIPPTVT